METKKLASNLGKHLRHACGEIEIALKADFRRKFEKLVGETTRCRLQVLLCRQAAVGGWWTDERGAQDVIIALEEQRNSTIAVLATGKKTKQPAKGT